MPDCANCGDPVCAAAADPCDASWQDVAECQRRAKELALAEVERLRAELAEARKPRWEGYDLTVPARKAIFAVRLQADGTGWRYFGVGCQGQRGYRSAAEAKAAAEKACGVDVEHG